jgi:hypothetical protein
MRRTMVALGLMIAGVTQLSAQGIDYSAEQERLCTGDAMRLCGAYIPNVDQITACMIRLQNQLSPPCRALFNGPAASPGRGRQAQDRMQPAPAAPPPVFQERGYR